MANFAQCILDAIADRKLGKKRAEPILELFKNSKQEYLNDGLPEALADAKAMDDALARYDIEVKERKKRALKNMLVEQRLKRHARESMERLRGTTGNIFSPETASKNVSDVLHSILVEVQGFQDVPSVASMRDIRKRQFMQMFYDIADKYGRKGLGWRTSVGQDNLMRELYGQDTGDQSAKVLAKAWSDLVDLAVSEFKRAGGTMMRRGDWRMPQHMDVYKLHPMGKEAFANFLVDKLDWKAMRVNGKRIVGREKQLESLQEVWETLVSNGANKPDRGSATIGTAIGNTLDHSRFLIYKDADSWLAMNKQLGKGNIFDSMVGHIEHMSEAIGTIDVLGPNPNMMKDRWAQFVKDEAGRIDTETGGGKAKRLLPRAEGAVVAFNNTWKELTRETRMPDANIVGAAGAATRNVLSSAFLGTATLAALPGDLALMFRRSRFDKIPTVRMLGQYVRMLNPLNKADRELAARMTGHIDLWTAEAHAATRFTTMETYGPAWSRFLLDSTLRMNLLSVHTDFARKTSEMNIHRVLTDDIDKAFADLEYREMLERYGINSHAWDAYRNTPKDSNGLIRIQDVYATDKNVADRFMRMIVTEGALSVPESNYRAAGFLRGGTAPGTWAGEWTRSSAMFKQFPTILLQNQMKTAVQDGVERGKWGHIVGLFISLTIAGVLAVQLKEIAKGRTPLSLVDEDGSPNWSLLAAGALQGGALGIFGDFIFADRNRYGGGLMNTVAGPPAQFANDLLNLTVGNVKDIVEGKDTRFTKELNSFVSRYAPMQNTFWFGLMLDRMFFDQIENMVDPKVESNRRRRETQRKKDYGNEYWWAPGQLSP